MRYKLSSLLIMLIGLTGCYSTANYEKMLSSWIGQSELELISVWGPPQSSYQASTNVKVIQFVSQSNVQIGGFTTTTPVTTYNTGSVYGNNGSAFYSGTSTSYVPTTTPIQNIALNCTTIFTIEDGIVSNWKWKGNACEM